MKIIQLKFFLCFNYYQILLKRQRIYLTRKDNNNFFIIPIKNIKKNIKKRHVFHLVGCAPKACLLQGYPLETGFLRWADCK